MSTPKWLSELIGGVTRLAVNDETVVTARRTIRIKGEVPGLVSIEDDPDAEETVVTITAIPQPETAPTTGQVLTWDGTKWDSADLP